MKIAIVGPECTGKTTLSKALAIHYKLPLVEEVAREYLEQLGRPYTFDDVIKIAKEQIARERKVLQQNKHVICDTDLSVIQVWLEDKFNECPQWIIDELKQQSSGKYLLLSPDLPWQADRQREDEHKREALFNMYKQNLNMQALDYDIISGKGEARTKKAIQIIDNILGS